MKPELDLTGKVALVSGAGSGMGREMALGAGALGASIVAVDIDGETGSRTAAEVVGRGGSAVAVAADCRVEADVLHAFAELDRTYGRIDILFANVGGSRHVPPQDLEVDVWEALLALNLTSTFLLAREAGRRMLASGVGGSIVTMSSISGSSALGRGSFAYSIAKAGVLQLTRELAVEWAHAGIRVNAIQPAQTRTPSFERAIADATAVAGIDLMSRFVSGIPLGRLGEPEEVASVALFLASDLARFVTGVCLPVDGGNLALNAGASR